MDAQNECSREKTGCSSLTAQYLLKFQCKQKINHSLYLLCFLCFSPSRALRFVAGYAAGKNGTTTTAEHPESGKDVAHSQGPERVEIQGFIAVVVLSWVVRLIAGVDAIHPHRTWKRGDLKCKYIAF